MWLIINDPNSFIKMTIFSLSQTHQPNSLIKSKLIYLIYNFFISYIILIFISSHFTTVRALTNDSMLVFFLPRKNKDSIGLRGIWGAQSQFCIYVTRSTVTSRCRKQVDNHIQAHYYTHTHIPNRTLRACECNSTAATCNGHSGHCGPVDCGWVLAFQLTSHRIRMGLMWGNCSHDLVNLVSIPLRY